MPPILQRISSRFDRSTDTLWFTGELNSGAQFSVGFPIAHVAVTFDTKMAEKNFVADPICGAIVSIDGFLGNLEAVCNSNNQAAVNAARRSYSETMNDLTHQAVHYGAYAHDAVMGSIFSSVAHAVSGAVKSVGKAASRLTNPGGTALIKTVTAGAQGKDMAAAFSSEVKGAWQDVNSIASAAKSVASVVPGVGTLASVAIGATQAGLSGKSLTEIIKAAGVSAIPGGPLAQQIAKAGINTIQAGVEGKNILRAAATQAVSSVAGLIPDPTAAALVQRVALDAASGKNIISATERAAADAAINLIPDATARDMARSAISGSLNPKTVLSELARSVVGKSAGPGAMQSLVAGSVENLSKLGSAGTQQLKQAVGELIEVSSNFVPDAAARQTIQAAVGASMQGKKTNLSTGTLAQSLAKVTDPRAKALLTRITQGQTDPAQLLKSIDGDYLATLLTLDPNSHLASALLQGQTVVSGPSGIKAPVRKGTPLAAPAVKITTSTPSAMGGQSSNRFRAIGARGLYDWRQALRG